MKKMKVPMRTCIVSKEKYPKQDLIRILRTPEGKIEIDKTGKKNGRGAYLKLDEKIIKLARKSKILDKFLSNPVSDIIFDDLLLMLEEL